MKTKENNVKQHTQDIMTNTLSALPQEVRLYFNGTVLIVVSETNRSKTWQSSKICGKNALPIPFEDQATSRNHPTPRTRTQTSASKTQADHCLNKHTLT
jgi:hypothetical protein